MQDLWGRGRVCSGKSPLSDNSSRVCKVGSSVAHIDLVGTGLRCRARHRGCVVPSLCESDSPVHCSRVLVRFLLSRYWTTCEEANLIQRCLGEDPPVTQRKTYRRIVNDPTSDSPLLLPLAPTLLEPRKIEHWEKVRRLGLRCFLSLSGVGFLLLFWVSKQEENQDKCNREHSNGNFAEQGVVSYT